MQSMTTRAAAIAAALLVLPLAGEAQTDVASLMTSAEESFQAGDYGQTKAIAERLVREDAPQGKYLLGVLYFHGLGVPRDFVEARELFEDIRHDLDHDEPDYYLGIMMIRGDGGARNPGEGLYTLCRAGARGNARAKELLDGLGDGERLCRETESRFPLDADEENVVETGDALRRHVRALIDAADDDFAAYRGETTYTRTSAVMSTYPIGSTSSYIDVASRTGAVGHHTLNVSVPAPRCDYPADCDVAMISALGDAVAPAIPASWTRDAASHGRSIMWKECEWGTAGRGRYVAVRLFSDAGGYGPPSLSVGAFPQACPGRD